MLQPIGNKIFVKQDDDVKQIGNIHLPDKVDRDLKKKFRGTVVAVGPGERFKDAPDKRREMPVKVGDIVHWNDRGGFLTDKVTIDGQELVILMPDDLMAVEVPNATV